VLLESVEKVTRSHRSEENTSNVTHGLKSLATVVMMYSAASDTSHDAPVPSTPFSVSYIYTANQQHRFSSSNILNTSCTEKVNKKSN